RVRAGGTGEQAVGGSDDDQQVEILAERERERPDEHAATETADARRYRFEFGRKRGPEPGPSGRLVYRVEVRQPVENRLQSLCRGSLGLVGRGQAAWAAK